MSDLKGFDDIKKRLATLPAKIEKNILRSAVRQGAQTVRKAANVTGGASSLEIGSSRTTERRYKAVAAGVRFKKEKFYLMFVDETGAAPHEIKPGKKGALANVDEGFFTLKAVQHPGIPEFNEVSKTLEEKEGEIIEGVRKQIEKRLDKEI